MTDGSISHPAKAVAARLERGAEGSQPSSKLDLCLAIIGKYLLDSHQLHELDRVRGKSADGLGVALVLLVTRPWRATPKD
jgi:hypothetical protein